MILSLLALASPGALAAEGFRQLGSHAHGHGTLNIAVDGKLVEMALEVPGADIVGFEHDAESAEDKAAIERAKATLRDGDALFVFSPDAGCELEKADVRLVGAEDDHDHKDSHNHGHKHDHGDDDKHGKKDAEADAETHSEFHAHYRFGCADPDQIAEIAFPFFDSFPSSQELQVQMITRRGTYGYDVEHNAPELKLTDQN